MTLAQAKAQAKRYSNKYQTFWYVREVTPNMFQPWAHDSNDNRTKAIYYCGNVWKLQLDKQDTFM